MPSGKETSRLRENLRTYVDRKQGRALLLRTLSEGGKAMETHVLPRLSEIPYGTPVECQDETGVFTYLPGYDGPLV